MAAPNWEQLFKDYDKDLDKIEQDRKDEQTALKAKLAVEKKELESDLTRPDDDPKRMEAVGRLTDFEAYEKMEAGKIDAKADAWKKTVEAEREANQPQPHPEPPKEAPKEVPQEVPKEEEAKSGGIMQKMADSTAVKVTQVATELTAAAFAGVMQVKIALQELSAHMPGQGKEIHQVEQKQHGQQHQPGTEKKEGPEPDLPHETAGELKDKHMKEDIEDKAKEAGKPDSLTSVFNTKAPPPPPPPKPQEEQTESKTR